MLIHNEPLMNIFFGDSRNQFKMEDIKNIKDSHEILDVKPFNVLKKIMKLKALDFLKQEHGIRGLYIKTEKQAVDLKPFSIPGDYLITNLKNIGIGIASADCLPIIFYDRLNRVSAIAHAGWKNSLMGISIEVIKKMKKIFNTKFENLIIFFGPSAKGCCYEVSSDFKNKVEDKKLLAQTIYSRKNKIFFDLPLFNILQLEKIGVKKESFRLDYNTCSIHNKSFCSYRRDNNNFRQMTVVALK